MGIEHRLRRWEVCHLVKMLAWRGYAHSMPESAKALWRMVSLTAAKTSRMFEVSVACVRLWGERGGVSRALCHVPQLDPPERSERLARSQTKARPMYAHRLPLPALPHGTKGMGYHSLRIQIQMRPVDLVKPPQKILRGAVNIISTAVIRKITPQRTPL